MERDKLYDAAIKSHDVLFRASTVFPFILFPDSIVLDREKLIIIHRPFFRMAKITAIRIKDILNAEVDVGPFFGQLRIVTRYYSGDNAQFAGADAGSRDRKPPSIKYLWRGDALKVHSLLQGYIIATQKEIDCTSIPKDELIMLLNDLGQSVAQAT
ncbi:hypothetical protein HYW36_00875 [Candidatus Saccharibacteria bacterium]|nr:hypothetical protein [Candidatus Saccharibacteria bacterium]